MKLNKKLPKLIIILALLITTVLLLVSFSGCGKNHSGSDYQPSAPTVPPQLVGKWSGGSSELFGSTYYHFWGNGTYELEYEKTMHNIYGTFQVRGNSILFYVNGRLNTQSTCSISNGLLYLDSKSYVYAGPP